MRKRPLCVGCGVFTIVLICLLTLFPIRTYNVTTLLGETITVYGRVSTIRYRNDTYQIFINSTASSGQRYKGVIAYLEEGSSLPHIGSLVCVKGRVSDFNDARNEGEFSLKRYYQIRGMDFALKNARIISESKSYNYLKHFLFKTNNRLCKTLDLILPEKDSGVMKAILLGKREELPEDIQALYQKAGISHALCISGLHISLIGMAVYEILKRLSGFRIRTAVLSASILIIYGMLSSNASATVRAIIMFIVMITGDVIGRSYDLCTALCFSGLCMLIGNPLLIYDSGFLLSYSAVLSVGTVFTSLRRIYGPLLKYKIFNSFLLSFSVTVLSLPITLYFFYQYPVYSIILNIFLIPLMSLLVLFGIISLSVGLIAPGIGICLSYVCRIILFIYEKACSVSTSLPHSAYIAGKPGLFQIIIYYSLIIFLIKFLNYKKQIIFPIGFALAVFVLFFTPKKGFELSVIDVGQGSCSLISTEDMTILFDGGSTDISDVGRYRIIPFLKSRGVRRIDGIFISHTDADHINGITEIITDYSKEIEIKNVFMTHNSALSKEGRRIAKLCRKRNIRVRKIDDRFEISVKNTQLKCLYPGMDLTGDVNELSMTLYVKYKDFAVLLPGDLEGESAQKKLIEKIDEKADCFIAAHHGSKGSNSTELLRCIKPKLSIVSCGVNNSYGHPHKEVVQRLFEAGSAVYITSESGQIKVRYDGKKCIVNSFLKTGG